MDQTRQTHLAQLKKLLGMLPSSAPPSTINFINFQVIPGEVNDYGYTGAINHALELTFGWKTHSSGDWVIPLTGRRQGLSVIIDVLRETIEQDPSEAALMGKWSEDLILAAQKAQLTSKVWVSSP
jgi:hypothetical protein